MKRKNFSSVVVFAVLIALCSFKCKKDDVQSVIPGLCRISTVTNAGYSPITITYRNDGKINSMAYEDVLHSYTYSGNTVIILTTENGAFDRRKTITLNSDGLPLNVRGDYNQLGTEWYNDAFQYNGKEVFKRIESDSYSSATETITYTWANGNLVKEQSASYGTTTYTYYTDKTIRDGDHFYYEQLISDGYQYVCNKHLLKSAKSNSSPEDIFYYTYDADGKITSYKEDNRQPASYAYKCN